MTTYCIVVEGQTERLYFKDAKVEYDRAQQALAIAARNAGEINVSVRSLNIVDAGGLSFEHVLRTALKQRPFGHERIFCVVDADFYARLTGEEKTLATEAYREAQEANIVVIMSNPCFEVWFRHHFNAETSAWIDGDTAKDRIRRLWPEYGSQPRRHWELLRPRQASAIMNAQRVKRHHGIPPAKVEACDASTDVDLLIQEILNKA